VLRLVPGQIARLQALRQHEGLAKGQAKTFARDRVYCAGGIPNQSNISAVHAFQLVSNRKRPRSAETISALRKRSSSSGKSPHGVIGSHLRITRHQSYADLLVCYVCHIGLGMLPQYSSMRSVHGAMR